MAISQTDEWIDKLFVQDVTELQRLGQEESREEYKALQMSAILRRLVLDGQPTAYSVAKRCVTPLRVLKVEGRENNERYVSIDDLHKHEHLYAPPLVEKDYPPMSGGLCHAEYKMDEYINGMQVILPGGKTGEQVAGTKITRREIILFLANKLGGVHADRQLKDRDEGGKSVDAETLYNINKNVTLFGQQSIFHQFWSISARIWRACAPLRDEIVKNSVPRT